MSWMVAIARSHHGCKRYRKRFQSSDRSTICTQFFFKREHVGERAYFPAKRDATLLPQRGVSPAPRISSGATAGGGGTGPTHGDAEGKRHAYLEQVLGITAVCSARANAPRACRSGRVVYAL